jgi:hypothetical protein
LSAYLGCVRGRRIELPPAIRAIDGRTLSSARSAKTGSTAGVAGAISHRNNASFCIARRAPMIQLSLAIRRPCSGMPWSDDLLKVSVVFIGAGRFMFGFFSAQLLLIYQLEIKTKEAAN